jgi:serine phosphatase RsbU (regulator of sigma subunit)/catechol 2,3-dioxygenase-like lactoylglutathione lyase family enzyme
MSGPWGFIITAMASSLSFGLADQSNLRVDRQNSYLRVHAVNIFVHDTDRSLRFYLDQLGFSLSFDVCLQSGQRWVAVAPPDGTAILHLVAPDPESEEYKLIGRPTGVVFVTEDVAAKYKEWRQRGVRFLHTPRLRRIKYQPQAPDGPSSAAPPLLGKETPVWGGVFTRFEDVDRNSFALVSFDEMSRTVEAERRAAEERMESERRIAHELEIAKQVQARLFPQILPPLRTLDYAGRCIQARQVGGDYYDFLDLGQECLGLVIGDISGKGIAAALLMANLQANLRSQCAISLEQPQQVLKAVNQLFCQNTLDGAFATLFFAEYHIPTGRLRYVNCGHLPALILRVDDTVERLYATSTVLGIFKKWDCELGDLTIHPGDTLALYTDGITESFNEVRDEFGEDRLIESLRRHRSQPAQSLLKSIIADVRQFSSQEQHDDITLIIAKSCPSSS